MKTYSVTERLDLIANALFKSRMSELGQAAGIDKTAVSRIRSGQLGLTPYYIDKIMSVSPGINRSWLETGEGYPGDISVQLVREKYESLLSVRDETIRTLTAQVSQSQKIIDILLERAK